MAQSESRMRQVNDKYGLPKLCRPVDYKLEATGKQCEVMTSLDKHRALKVIGQWDTAPGADLDPHLHRSFITAILVLEAGKHD